MVGRFQVDSRYGAGITVRALRPAAEGEYDLADLTEAPPIPYAQMAEDLRSLVNTVQQPHLRELLARLLDPTTESGPCTTRRRPPSTTTRPTATDCSSTACRWPRA